jgi:hypothetical protein
MEFSERQSSEIPAEFGSSREPIIQAFVKSRQLVFGVTTKQKNANEPFQAGAHIAAK